uniref:Uncharacterized protein n=1 Tax=Arabidopsis thaliana TaxID=3702 RepID=Q0WUK9_ARATH|nr:hypothetical protein [Arabidopsis thaliana]
MYGPWSQRNGGCSLGRDTIEPSRCRAEIWRRFYRARRESTTRVSPPSENDHRILDSLRRCY